MVLLLLRLFCGCFWTNCLICINPVAPHLHVHCLTLLSVPFTAPTNSTGIFLGVPGGSGRRLVKIISAFHLSSPGLDSSGRRLVRMVNLLPYIICCVQLYSTLLAADWSGLPIPLSSFPASFLHLFQLTVPGSSDRRLVRSVCIPPH